MTQHDDARSFDHAARVRRLEGSYNLRDLGGVPASEGRWVKRGLVFRSDYPTFAGTADGAGPRSLGLRTVVDLRRGAEAAYECVDWGAHGVAYERCPISAGGEASWHARYAAYLSHRPETVVAAVRCVLDPTSQPVLFHCAAGKDRTGVVAAMLYSLLGVPPHVIVEDYLQTAPSVPTVLTRLRAAGPYATMLAGDTDEDQMPRAEHIQRLLDHLNSHGGSARWLVDHGLTRHEIDLGRAVLLG